MGRLQIVLFVLSFLFLTVIIRYIKKSKLSTDLATLWILWGFGLILLSIFPTIISFIAKILGIIAPINALFLIMIFLLYCMVFYLFLKVSILEDNIKNLIQYIALQENKRNK